ncbi:MAG: homoserine kinase [Sumerlaeia bacterium]
MSFPKPFSVIVPCSTSNIGPGFDCLGLAFQLHNEFAFNQQSPTEGLTLNFSGPEKGRLVGKPDGFFFQAMRRVFEYVGEPIPAMRVEATVNVPNARGLGSSSTAIIGAMLGANRIIKNPLSRDQILHLAVEFEGHPDNVTPALMGGLSASLMTPQKEVITQKYSPSEKIGFVVLSPDYEVPTSEARQVLPKSVSLTDAIANSCRVPLLIQALVDGDLSNLKILTQDRFHESQREHLMRHSAHLKRTALDAGAASATVSGAGPSLLAIATVEQCPEIAEAWNKEVKTLGLGGMARILKPDLQGARYREVEAAVTA